MKDKLAEELLARVMGWNPAQVAQHRATLQALALYKYDEYQQFSPGMRFIESLAMWLEQFKTKAQREVAFKLASERLVFVSTAELNHLVSIAYQDFVRPSLLARSAHALGVKPWYVGRVMNSEAFKLLEKRALFLGLSDGARTDVFRRANHLSNEQIRLTHELSHDRIEGLLKDLRRELRMLLGKDPADEVARFNTLVLLDDFSGSGFSYIRQEDGQTTGKIKKFFDRLTNDSDFQRLVDPASAVIVVLYLATFSAKTYLEAELAKLFSGSPHNAALLVVQIIPESVRIRRGDNPELDEILKTYYDDTNETDSTRKGKTDLRYGFAASGLPLVLSHNTPNNSLGILWAKGPKMHPLFPRVTRHLS